MPGAPAYRHFPMKTKSKISHDDIVRCSWARNDLSIRYHDCEWGVPQHDDRVLFEFLVLEGAQAGLSWDTILRKRDNYRAAFDNFDPRKISKYDQRKLHSLTLDEGIVRNRLKILSAVGETTLDSNFATNDVNKVEGCLSLAAARQHD